MQTAVILIGFFQLGSIGYCSSKTRLLQQRELLCLPLQVDIWMEFWYFICGRSLQSSQCILPRDLDVATYIYSSAATAWRLLNSNQRKHCDLTTCVWFPFLLFLNFWTRRFLGGITEVSITSGNLQITLIKNALSNEQFGQPYKITRQPQVHISVTLFFIVNTETCHLCTHIPAKGKMSVHPRWYRKQKRIELPQD